MDAVVPVIFTTAVTVVGSALVVVASVVLVVPLVTVVPVVVVGTVVVLTVVSGAVVVLELLAVLFCSAASSVIDSTGSCATRQNPEGRFTTILIHITCRAHQLISTQMNTYRQRKRPTTPQKQQKRQALIAA